MRAGDRYAAQNRRARHDYLIEETLEAGLVLQGSEVKVLRQGQASIDEAYADETGGEMFLVNANIPEYARRRRSSTTSRAGRASCCCIARRWTRLLGAISREGVTIVPLSIYFNERGRAKVELGLARGKKQGRQAPGREGPRLAARQGPHHAGARLRRSRKRCEHRLEHRRGQGAGVGVEPRAVIAVGEQHSVGQFVQRRRERRGRRRAAIPLPRAPPCGRSRPAPRSRARAAAPASSAARNGRQAAISRRLGLVLRRHAAHRVGDAGADAARARRRDGRRIRRSRSRTCAASRRADRRRNRR